MSFVAAVTIGLLAVSSLVLGVAVTTVAARALRRRREARRRAVAEPLRPLLLEVAVGDGEDAVDAAASLAALDADTWRTVEPAVLAVLGKVRGEGQRLLVEMLADRGVVDRARRQLVSRSAVRRAGAAELLGEAAYAPAVLEIAVLLTDRDAEVRLVAARALGYCATPGAVGLETSTDAAATAAQALLEALASGGPAGHDGHAAVPSDVVARSLLLIGSPAAPAMVEALGSPVAVVRLTAAEVLGRLGATAAARTLEDVLLRDDVAEVRRRAATALGRLGLPSSVSVLRTATNGAVDAGVRLAAVVALGEVGDPSALRCLWALLADGDARVADAAAAALLGLGAPGVRVLAQVAAQEGLLVLTTGAQGSATAGSWDTRRGAVERAHEVIACAVLAEVMPAAGMKEVDHALGRRPGQHLAGVGAGVGAELEGAGA